MPRRCCLLSASTLLFVFAFTPAAEPESAVVLTRLIGQLGDDDFDVRLAAGQRLLQFGEAALPRLDAAAQSDDAEVRRLARDLARRIRAVSRERQVKQILNEVNAIGLDRFIDRMVKEKDFATEERWSKTIELGMAVGERAVEFGGPEFVGWRHVAKLPVVRNFNEGGRLNGRGLLDGLDDYQPQINNAVVVATRLNGRLRAITGSVLIVNGDLDYVTNIDNSIIICNGNISDVRYVRNSVIVVTGRVGRVRSVIGSVVQAKSFDSCYESRGGVYLNLPRPTNDDDTGDVTMKTTRGPLDLFSFPSRTDTTKEREAKER